VFNGIAPLRSRRCTGCAPTIVSEVAMFILGAILSTVVGADVVSRCELDVAKTMKPFQTPTVPTEYALFHFEGPSNVSTRYIASNHKTGSFFARCLCQAMGSAKGAAVAPCNLVTMHTAGQGLYSHAWSINMVRDPFVVIHSGYEYHLKTTEPWAIGPIDAGQARTFGVPQALESYRRWKCSAMRFANASLEEHSYQTILRVSYHSRVAVMIVLAHDPLCLLVRVDTSSARRFGAGGFTRISS